MVRDKKKTKGKLVLLPIILIIISTVKCFHFVSSQELEENYLTFYPTSLEFTLQTGESYSIIEYVMLTYSPEPINPYPLGTMVLWVSEGYENWLISVEPTKYNDVYIPGQGTPSPDPFTFDITIIVPIDTPQGIYTFDILAVTYNEVSGEWTSAGGRQGVTVTVSDKHADPVGDIFTPSGPAMGPNYIDIVYVNMLQLDSVNVECTIEVFGVIPGQLETSFGFFWAIDTDRDSNTGSFWPFLTNDIGVDSLVGLIYTKNGFQAFLQKPNGEIITITDFSVYGNTLKVLINLNDIENPNSFDWVSYTLYGEPEPNVFDKVPNSGHITFESEQHPQYTLTIVTSGMGTTSPEPGAYLYDEETIVLITAIPEHGWIFDHWELNGMINNESPLIINIKEDVTLYARFSIKYTQIFTSNIVIEDLCVFSWLSML